MRHILKASFDQRSDAQHLLDELLAAGYTSATLGLSGATHSGHFTRQRSAVTLMLDDEPDAMRARDIMQRSGAARVQDFEDGTGTDMPAYPPGTEPGALQFRPLAGSRFFGTQNAASPPVGTTFQERMDAPFAWDGVEEPVVVPHGERSAGLPDARSGERDLPSYMDADESSRSETYRTHDREAPRARPSSAWHDFEDAVQHGWHRISAGVESAYRPNDTTPSTWQRIKVVVRHGWDRVRS